MIIPSMITRALRQRTYPLLRLALALLILIATSYEPQFSGLAAPDLSIEPITWNIIGLDSNDPSTGPDKFPVAARVCNSGDEAATNLTARFVFDDGEDLYAGHDYINLRAGSLSEISLASLGPQTIQGPTCTDFYFEVEIKRTGEPHLSRRLYHIEVTADGGLFLSTPSA